VVCAIEAGAEGVVVARQAIALAPAGVPVVLVGAVDLEAAERAMQPMSGEMDTGQLIAPIPVAAAEVLMGALRDHVEAARTSLAEVAEVTTSVVEGPLIVAMQEAAGEDPGALLALEAPHERRTLGIIGGEPATWLLHETSQPVLLARTASRPEPFPRAIAVGYDGGPASTAAVEAAGAIAALRGSELRVIIAKGGPEDGIGPLALGLPAHEVVHDRHNPVHALSDADADLVVVGSRGLHGLRALGSVSERVAHRSHASVLVVR
jgi:nucleotide-binding universal stress UspA family protein